METIGDARTSRSLYCKWTDDSACVHPYPSAASRAYPFSLRAEASRAIPTERPDVRAERRYERKRRMSAEGIMTPHKDQRRRLFLPPFLLHFCDLRRAISSPVTTAPPVRCPPHMQGGRRRAEEGRSCQTIAGRTTLRPVAHLLPSRSNFDSDETRILRSCACVGAHQRAPSIFQTEESKGERRMLLMLGRRGRLALEEASLATQPTFAMPALHLPVSCAPGISQRRILHEFI